MDIRSGAREIQWLATNFNQMMAESEETIKRLVDAERRALQLLNDQDCRRLMGTEDTGNTEWNQASPEMETGIPVPLERIKLIEDYLWDKCRLMEKIDPEQPKAQELALEVWQQDALNAGRLGLHNLKASLENLAFHILNPAESDQLQDKINLRIANIQPQSS